MKDRTDYIRFNFEGDNTSEIYTNALSFIVNKDNVTIRAKWKKVRISEDSLYVGLNDNPKFIEALTKVYNTNYDSYMYYLPVSYKAHLVSKDESMDNFMDLHVDIPFSDIEVY